MPFTHKLGKTYNTDAGSVASVVKTYTADGEVGFSGTVPKSTTNMEIDLPVDKSAIVSMVLHSTVALTLKTNDSGSPQETIALGAGQMLEWNTDHADACPFSADVTKIFATNANGTTDAVLKIHVLFDTTP